jgi:hypothetical protein
VAGLIEKHLRQVRCCIIELRHIQTELERFARRAADLDSAACTGSVCRIITPDD